MTRPCKPWPGQDLSPSRNTQTHPSVVGYFGGEDIPDLSPEFRRNVPLEYAHGFLSCIGCAALLLERAIIPTPALIAAELKCEPVCQFLDFPATALVEAYFAHGGRIAYALDHILTRAEVGSCYVGTGLDEDAYRGADWAQLEDKGFLDGDHQLMRLLMCGEDAALEGFWVESFVEAEILRRSCLR